MCLASVWDVSIVTLCKQILNQLIPDCDDTIEHCKSLQTDLRLIKNASRLLRYDWATSYYGTSVVWWLTGKRFKTNARLWIVVLLKIKTINNIVGLKKAKRPKQVFKKKKLFFGLFTNGIVTLKQNKSKEQFINRSS